MKIEKEKIIQELKEQFKEQVETVKSYADICCLCCLSLSELKLLKYYLETDSNPDIQHFLFHE